MMTKIATKIETVKDITPSRDKVSLLGLSTVSFERNLFCASLAYSAHDNFQLDAFPKIAVDVKLYDSQTSSWEDRYHDIVPSDTNTAAPHFPSAEAEGSHYFRSISSGNDTLRFLTFEGDNIFSSSIDLYLSSQNQVQVLSSVDGVTFVWLPQTNSRVNQLRQQSTYAVVQKSLYCIAEANIQLSDGPPQRLLVAPIIPIRNWRLPENNQWKDTVIAALDDKKNTAISGLANWDGSVCAGIDNPSRGFQLWKALEMEQLPHTWDCLLFDGAFRYSLNQNVFAMAPFQGDLYVACGVSSDASDSGHSIYRCGFELLRIYPNHDWDIIIGSPKFTPGGLRVPLSAMGPGLEDPTRHQVLALFTHHNALYMATQGTSGFELWMSLDGEDWESVPLNGLEQYYQVKVKRVFSMDFGLVMELDLLSPAGESQPRVLLLS